MPTKSFIWDPETDAYLMEKDGDGNITAVYTQEPVRYGNLISQRRAGETSYYHQDALGSTLQLTDEDENVTDEYAYSAYGEAVAQSGTTVNAFRWIGAVGYYLDADTHLYYVRARHYDIPRGRWLIPDPLWTVDGPVVYLMLPFNSIDPSGLAAIPAPRPIPKQRNRCEIQFENCRHICGAVAVGQSFGILLLFANCIRHGFHFCYWPCFVPNNPICNACWIAIIAECTWGLVAGGCVVAGVFKNCIEGCVDEWHRCLLEENLPPAPPPK
jgi:RHS repeat-associated protein